MRYQDANVKLQLITAPTIEPVTLDEAKFYLNIDIDLDDTLITSLIKAARLRCETITQRSFITTTWLQSFDFFQADHRHHRSGYSYGINFGYGNYYNWNWHNGDRLEVFRPRLQSVDYLKYYDSSDSIRTLDSSLYTVSTGTPGFVVANPNTTFPNIICKPGAVLLQYKAGYGDTADTVPEDIKLAIKILTFHYYQNRMPVSEVSLSEVPMSVESLLANHQWGAGI